MSDSKETESSRYGTPIYRAEEEPKDIKHPNSRKGTHKVLNQLAVVAIGIGTVLSPSIANIASAEPINQVDLTQNSHDNALNALIMSQEERAKYTSEWYSNIVGAPFYESPTHRFTSIEDLGNGYTARIGVDGTKIITDKNNVVVFKNVILGTANINEFDIVMIPVLLRAKPLDPTPALEYGADKIRLSFPDRGLAVITTPFEKDWSYSPVFAVEGFKVMTNIDQYNASPWILADNQPQAGNPDNNPQ